MNCSLCRSRFVWTLAVLFTMAVTPAFAQKGGKGGGGGGSGDGVSTAPKFAIEVATIPGATVLNFNDSADLLLQTEVIDEFGVNYTPYLGTLDSGVRSFEQIRLPQGWFDIQFFGMNDSRELVGRASYDPEGDGLDANGDYELDPGNVISAGILVTPDVDNDGIWELTILFPGPMDATCWQINNDGDIVGRNNVDGNVLLRREGTLEPFPITPISTVGNQQLLTDRDTNGHVTAINSGKYYTPRKYETRTGLETVLPTFDNATFVDAYAYAINKSGEVVGRADGYPAYWSPSGAISRIPGWAKSKTATGYALGINDSGEIVISSANQGPHLYSPASGLHPLSNAIINPEAIPAGYQVYHLRYINNFTEIAGYLRSDSGPQIPFVLYPVDQP